MPEKKWGKIMAFVVATNVVASQPPERQPTGTPTTHARMAKKWHFGTMNIFFLLVDIYTRLAEYPVYWDTLREAFKLKNVTNKLGLSCAKLS